MGVDRSTQKRLVNGSASVLTGALTAFVAAAEKLLKGESLIKSVFEAAPGIQLAVVLGGMVVCLVCGREAFLRSSRLLNADKLVPRSSDPDQLIGRDAEIQQLVGLCNSERLVFVRGTSGVGKSALVGAGLVRALESENCLPLLVTRWGFDSEKGPADELGAAMVRRLRDSALHLGSAPPVAQLASVLDKARTSLGLNPVLVFDQFDEYQTRHRAEFVKDGVWVSPEELCKENAFWRVIQHVLKKGTATCVFVARNDADLGMLQFTASRTFEVFPLDRQWVNSALEVLTSVEAHGRPVIEDPELSWNRLRVNIADDLMKSGAAHPVQLRLALQALPTLTSLTTGAYAAVGRLDGMIANLMTSKVKTAAAGAGISDSVLLTCLARLVDEEASATQEVQEVSLIADEPRLKAALEALSKDEIVKHRGTDDARRWLLFHDFMAPAVLEAERRREALTQEFQRRHREYEATSGFLESWNCLLPIRLQLRLWLNAPARRAYLGSRIYALLSSLRFVPFVAAGALLYALAAWVLGDLRAGQLRAICLAPSAGDEQCVSALHDASGKLRFRALRLDWTDRTALEVNHVFAKLEHPWPAELPDESGAVRNDLIPCALGQSPLKLFWTFARSIPLLSFAPLTMGREQCAERAMSLTLKKRETARDLLPGLALYPIELQLGILAQLEDSDIAYRPLADAVNKQISSVGGRLLDVYSATALNRSRRPDSKDATTNLDAGRERLITLVETTRDPWYGIGVYYTLVHTSSASQMKRLREAIFGSDLGRHKGDYPLLVAYVRVLRDGGANIERNDAAANILGTPPVLDVQKWLWVSTLCAAGAVPEKIPLDFDPNASIDSILTAPAAPSFAFSGAGAPLSAFVDAALCKYPASLGGDQGVAARLGDWLDRAMSDPDRAPPRLLQAVEDIPKLWPFSNAKTRRTFLAFALRYPDHTPEIFRRTEGHYPFLEQVLDLFKKTESAQDAAEMCGVVQGRIEETTSGFELAPLGRAAAIVCTAFPEEAYFKALRRSDFPQAWILQSALGVVSKDALCRDPCFPLDLAVSPGVRGTLLAIAPIGDMCPTNDFCQSAPRFAQLVAQSGLAPIDESANWQRISSSLIAFAHAIPADRREAVLRTLIEQSRGGYAAWLQAGFLGVTGALCGASEAELAAALAFKDSPSKAMECKDYPRVTLPAAVAHPPPTAPPQ